jgi:hypothetical protein
VWGGGGGSIRNVNVKRAEASDMHKFVRCLKMSMFQL